MDRNLPTGPKGNFLLGSLPELSKDLNQFMLNTSRAFPGIAHFKLPGSTWFLVSDPDYIKTVLVTDHKKYWKNQFFWKHTKPLLGESLLVSNGEIWRKQRKLSAPAFHPRSLSYYATFMREYTEQWCNKFSESKQIDIQEEMSELTANIVVKALFGSNLHGAGDVISTAIKDATDVIFRRYRKIVQLPFFIPTRDHRLYRGAVKKIDDVVFKFIRGHHSGEGSESTLLSMLMNAKDEDGKKLTDQQLRNEVTTLFLAGHETTSLALTWAWYLLSQHPKVEDKLHRELRDVLQGETPSLEDIPKLHYATSVIKEAMRIYPPAYGYSREAIEDTRIGPYDIAKGSIVFMSTWALNRDEKYFPEPETFDPDRWTPEFQKSLPKYLYIPFGGGPRVCIGEGFAMTEAVMLLAMIAQKFTFEYNGTRAPEPYPAVTLKPAEGMPMILRKRSGAN